MKKQVQQLEKRMQELEQQIDEIETALAEPTIYQAENRVQMEGYSRKRAELGIELSDTEENWLVKCEELELLAQEIPRQSDYTGAKNGFTYNLASSQWVSPQVQGEVNVKVTH